MEIVINGKNNIWKDTYDKKVKYFHIFSYNKISNMIYIVNYNLVLNIFNKKEHLFHLNLRTTSLFT